MMKTLPMMIVIQQMTPMSKSRLKLIFKLVKKTVAQLQTAELTEQLAKMDLMVL